MPTKSFTLYVLLQFMLGLTATVVAGAVLFLLFERPFMSTRRNRRSAYAIDGTQALRAASQRV
jgi:peptidoglycan/LPS O-acetylase OafA/YrhL